MRITDQVTVWVASHQSQIKDGVAVDGYVRLRELCAGVQYLSDEMERKVFGEVSGGAIALYTPTVPDVAKGDALFLSRPEPIGKYLEQDDFGPGEYRVESVKPAHLNPARLRNPTTITARRLAE